MNRSPDRQSARVSANLNSKRLRVSVVAAFMAACLWASACSTDDDPALGDGSLGVVTVEEGESVQIRTINTFDVPDAGALDYVHTVAIAVDDYGPIHGEFAIELGEPVNDSCSADDGPEAAAAVLADGDVLGVIGPSCSATATTAVPLITDAAQVAISMSNTSPLLTSDLAGEPAQHHSPGYYRTAHNDLYQGEAVSAFLHSLSVPPKAAVVHEGDAYTEGLARAFSDAIRGRGGTVTDFIEFNTETTDLTEVLNRIAAREPAALFFPLTQDSAVVFTDAVRAHGGFDDVTLLSGDGVLHGVFLEADSSAGVFISGPDLDFGDNTNQATNMNAEQVTQRLIEVTGAPPVRAFWAHAYDATTLLLDAITAASEVEGGKLVVDRAGIREYLDQVREYQGITGRIACDEFGDCGPGRISIIEHLDPSTPFASLDNVVYRFAP